MAINVIISTNTLDLLENSYNEFKNNVLRDIFYNFLENKVSINEFMSIIKKTHVKRQKKKIIVKKSKNKTDLCIAYIWNKGEKKQCNNSKMKNENFCGFHILKSKRYYGIINN